MISLREIKMIENEVVNQAIAYILEHINEKITVEEVAEHCHFSKYYFSRIFKEQTDESVYAFIKRMKMEQSAFRLKVEKERSVTDIGYEYGYSPSNYSVVFRQHHHCSPANFRKNIDGQSLEDSFWQQGKIELESLEECEKKISVEKHPDYYVLYERYKGNYSKLGDNWNAFTEKYKEYVTDQTIFLERTFDDPSITDSDNCLYDICMSIDENSEFENTYKLQGGKFAVYHFKGHVSQIYKAYQSMFQVWFPKTNHRIDERYGFEIYRKIDCDTMQMEIDLCIPVK